MGEDGGWISVRRSLLRTGILSVSRFLGPLNPYPISGSLLNTFVTLVTTTLDVGTLYFYLFNRQTRQGMHDLIARTCVVRSPARGKPSLPPPARLHVAVCGALILFFVALWWVVANGIVFHSVGAMYRVSQTVVGFPEVRACNAGPDIHYEGKKKTFQGVSVTAALQHRLPCRCSEEAPEGFRGKPNCQCSVGQPSGVPLNAMPGLGRPGGKGYGYEPSHPEGPAGLSGSQQEPACACSRDHQPCACDFRDQPGCPCALNGLADRIAGLVLNSYPDIDQQDQLSIQVVYGWDIGLSEGRVGYPVTLALSPEQWRKRLEKP